MLAEREAAQARLVASNIEKDGIVVAIPVNALLTATTFEPTVRPYRMETSPPANALFDVEDMLKKEVLFLLQAVCLWKKRRQGYCLWAVKQYAYMKIAKDGFVLKLFHPIYWKGHIERFGRCLRPF